MARRIIIFLYAISSAIVALLFTPMKIVGRLDGHVYNFGVNYMSLLDATGTWTKKISLGKNAICSYEVDIPRLLVMLLIIFMVFAGLYFLFPAKKREKQNA